MLRAELQQLADGIGRNCGYAMRAGKVVEGAVTTDGDHSRTGGDRLGRSLVRYAGQLGGAAEQQLTLPSVRLQRGFDDFALRPRVAAARCRIDDELER